jgi:hypothetical protein
MTLIKIASPMAMPNRNIDCDAESDSDAGCKPERVKTNWSVSLIFITTQLSAAQ